jgi:peptidoglycan/LPS O-acetylase OafA/YrhL
MASMLLYSSSIGGRLQNNHRIQHIDVWRFIAIAMVIACHVVAYSHPWYREHIPALVWRLQNVGTFGVHIFFCISGFVICRGLLQERARTSSISIKGFYIRRLFRIAPPLMLYLLGVALFTAAGLLDVSPENVAQAGLFLCNIKALGDCGWSLGHTWSLAYEEQFYLFFPLLVMGAGLGVIGTKRRLLLATLTFVAAAIIALLFSRYVLAEFISTFIYMLCGCVFAAYWDQLEVVIKRMSPLLWSVLAAITFSVGCFFVLPDPIGKILHATIMPLAICLTVFGTPVSVSIVGKIFLNKWISYLGKISFTLYLWQQLATADYSLASPMFAFVMIIVVFAIALLSYRYFELPLIRLGARLSASSALVRVNLDDEKRNFT